MKDFKWDFPAKSKIEFFDSDLTYEISGYRPVTETMGLDFDPDWFREATLNKDRTGKYCNFPRGSRSYKKFWEQELDRSTNGMVVNGYRITGDHYFFLNYYVLLNVSKVTQAGAGRTESTPDFYSKQYEYFHYIDICEKMGRDVIAFKSRGVGFSEIATCLGVRPYTTTKNYQTVYVAFSEGLLEPTIAKAWTQLEYLNMETEGGFRRLRQNINQSFYKQASKKNTSGEVSGHMAEIKGIVVDNARKLRGRRIDRLIYEEAGSNPILKNTYIKGEALVELSGKKIGTRVVFGTGGDSGPALAGLDTMFKDPEAFGGLFYRHRHNREGKQVLSAFFIPADTCVTSFQDPETNEEVICIDHRGVTNTTLARQYYNHKRSKLAHLPSDLLDYCAEYCYYPEEALIKQGQNNFNQVLLAEQYAELEIHKNPEIQRPEAGRFFWRYNSTGDIIGVRWEADPTGDVFISEHPRLDDSNLPMRNLYVAGIDSIDHGSGDSVVADKGSKFCIMVKKRTLGIDQGNAYICRYLDRPHDVRRAYTVAAQILWYYGCKGNLEDTKIGFRSWLREKKWDTKMLMTRPSYAMDPNRRGKGQTLWGTPGSEKMILHGLELIADYIEDYYFKLNDIDVIEQLQKFAYEEKGKFDIVMAMVYTEIGDEDMYDLRVKETRETYSSFQDVGYYYDESGRKQFGVIPKYNEQRNDDTNGWSGLYPTRNNR